MCTEGAVTTQPTYYAATGHHDAQVALDDAQHALQALKSGHWEAADTAADAVVELAWEKLHTGHWQHVSPVRRPHQVVPRLHHTQAWRELYALGCAAQAAAKYNLALHEASLHLIDRGLVLGGNALRDQLHAAAQHVHGVLAAASQPDTMVTGMLGTPPAHPVPLPPGSLAPPGKAVVRLHRPSLDAFIAQCLASAQPAVLTGMYISYKRACHHRSGCMEHWPALHRWQDASYFARMAGARTVPVEIGAHYLADGWGTRLLPLAKVLRAMLGGGDDASTRHYLAQHALLDQVPALLADVATPDYCCVGAMRSVNAWIGPAGTVWRLLKETSFHPKVSSGDAAAHRPAPQPAVPGRRAQVCAAVRAWQPRLPLRGGADDQQQPRQFGRAGGVCRVCCGAV